MYLELADRFYIRSGVKFCRIDDCEIFFSSPYNCDRCSIKVKDQSIIDVVANLDKEKSLKQVIEGQGYSVTVVDNEEFVKTLSYLIKQDIIGKKPYDGLLSESEVDYYANNIFHLNHVYGEDGIMLQYMLKQKRICIVGLGGSASMLLVSLIGMGIGTIRLIDYDYVEEKNLHRQIFYKCDDVGNKKAGLMERFIKDLNKYISVESHDFFVDEKNKDNLNKIFDGCDLVIVAADEPDYFTVLKICQDVCFGLDIPFIGVCGGDGTIFPLVIPYESACIDCAIEFITRNDSDKKLMMMREFYFSSDYISRLRNKNTHPVDAVPYSYILKGNAYVAKEIVKFLLTRKSEMIDHIYSDLRKKHLIPRKKGCMCGLKKAKKAKDL